MVNKGKMLEKRSLVCKPCRRISPVLRRRQHKTARSKSVEDHEGIQLRRGFDHEDFDHRDRKAHHLLRRNNSLPNIQSICKQDNYTNDWCGKSWNKRYSLKRSQSMEWEPVSALFTAITENDLKELNRILQEFDMELNFLGSAGISLLHTAALVGNTAVIELLLKSGAEIEFQDANNRTSLEIALLAGHYDCAALLIENGACMSNVVDGIKLY